MSSLASFVHRTQFIARFKSAMLHLWLPFVLAAAVPAVATTIAYWFEKPSALAPEPVINSIPDGQSLPEQPPLVLAKPVEAPPEVIEAAPEVIPPPSALIGARVIGGNGPIWHVEAVGTDSRGKTVSVFMRNDATRERATAPVSGFGWKWDPKSANAPATAYAAEPRNSWVWIKDKADLPAVSPQ
jgi:hypothetical protein